MFSYKSEVYLADVDAAGIVFFANYIKLAHYAYEAFMKDINYDLKYVLEEADELLVIVHVEADYKNSLKLNDCYEIKVEVTKIGGSSFSLKYLFERDGLLCAEVQTVHVAIDKNNNKPIGLSDKLKSGLGKYYSA